MLLLLVLLLLQRETAVAVYANGGVSSCSGAPGAVVIVY